MATVIHGAGGRSGRMFIKAGENSWRELCVTCWNATETAEEVDTTCSTSGGYKQVGLGARSLEGSISGNWDSVLNPMTDDDILFNDFTGQSYAMRLHLRAPVGTLHQETTATGDYIDIPTAVVNNIAITAPADGVVEFSFDFKSNGTYTNTSAQA